MKNSDHYSNVINLQQALIQRLNKDVYLREWVTRAACRGSDLDFFPWFRGGAGYKLGLIQKQREDAAEQLKLCAHCPVKKECKHDHLHEREGIFYGTVPLERTQARPHYDWMHCECLHCKTRQIKQLKRIKDAERRDERTGNGRKEVG